jgi:hypothetical protein
MCILFFIGAGTIQDRFSGPLALDTLNAASLLPTVLLLWRTSAPLPAGVFALALACLLYMDGKYTIINLMDHPPRLWSLYPWQALCVVACIWLAVWLFFRGRTTDDIPPSANKKRRDPPVVTVTIGGILLLTLLGGCTALTFTYPASICNEASRQEKYVRERLHVGMSRSELYALQKTVLSQKNGVMFVLIIGIQSPLNGPDQTGELPEPTSSHPTPGVRVTFGETTHDSIIVLFDRFDRVTRWKPLKDGFYKSDSYCAEVGR